MRIGVVPTILRSAYAGFFALLAFSATPATATDASVLLTDGHPFQAMPIDNGVLVSVSANGRLGSTTGIRSFIGPSLAQLTMNCLQPIDALQAFGFALTPNGSGIAIAAGDAGLILLDRAKTIAGCHARGIPVAMGKAGSRQGSFDVVMSTDGRFAFVANEYGVAAKDSTGHDIPGHVAVVALSYDAQGVPIGGTLVGRIVTGGSTIAGLALSPDGRRLYVTSELARPGARAANLRERALAHDGCRQGDGPPHTFGLLSVVDVSKVDNGAPLATVSATAAGCNPVRVIVSQDGKTVWVAARGDNKVFAFSATALEADPSHALLGQGDSGGEAPIGLTLFGNGKRLAVVNSNRFGGANASGNLALLDADPAAPKVTATVPVAHFPRSVTAASDGNTLLLTEYNGGQVQIISGQ